jgi:hypothetical protein
MSVLQWRQSSTTVHPASVLLPEKNIKHPTTNTAHASLEWNRYHNIIATPSREAQHDGGYARYHDIREQQRTEPSV